MAMYSRVLAEFSSFCDVLNLAEGQSASVALHHFMNMTAAERESAARAMNKWLNAGAISPDEEAGNVAGRAAVQGALKGHEKHPALKQRKTGTESR